MEFAFYIPIENMDPIEAKNFFKAGTNYLDENFVVESALSLYVSYLMDDRRSRHLEDVILDKYSEEMAKDYEGEATGLSEYLRNRAWKLSAHIDKVSTYISTIPYFRPAEDIITETSSAVSVKNCRVKDNQIRFILSEQ